jgi:DNA-binding PadR family transcriptional regulator
MITSKDVTRAVLNREAMVYPALRDLVDGGYLDCHQEEVEGERRHVCRLTEKGKEAYLGAAGAWKRVR